MSRVEVIGDATLYLGDCMEILPTLPKVDAVITDPPYGMGLDTDYSGFDQRRGKRAGKSYAPVAGDDRPFDPRPFLALGKKHIFWGAQYFAHSLPETGGWLVFNKRGDGEASKLAFGDCELAWTDLGRQSVRMHSQVWHGPARFHHEGAHHPTQKSIALMKWCIEQAGRPETILDPYMGSGTTGCAAVALGLRFIGIELSEEYFDIACRRIEQAYKQRPLFEAEPQPKPQQMEIGA